MGGSSSKPSQPKNCEVQAWDFPDKWGSHITFKIKSGVPYLRFNNLGDWNWNDDIQTIELRGPKTCWLRVCEHHNLRGKCRTFLGPTTRTFHWNTEYSNMITSLEFGDRNDGRRRGGLENMQDLIESEDSMEESEESLDMFEVEPSKADPICTAMYEELLLDGELSVEKLASECQALEDEAARDLCTFNVYAGAELFDSADLREALEMAEADENAMTELEHCQFIAEEIFQLALDGELAGVDVMLDGDDNPYYQLDQDDGAATFGAMVALLIGKPIVKIAMSMLS